MPRGCVLFFALLVACAACAQTLPEHVDLKPEAEGVEFAMEAPSPHVYKLLGKVIGLAAANDPEAAHSAAKNDLRNKAAALGATLVTIDEDLGEPMPLADKTRVKLIGRAYRAVD
jgi:hypothetical protein